jgi:hypothetical protein
MTGHLNQFLVGSFAVWAIFRSNQLSTTGLSKAVVCAVKVCGKVHKLNLSACYMARFIPTRT